MSKNPKNETSAKQQAIAARDEKAYQLIEAGIENHFEAVDAISGEATGEDSILVQIKEIVIIWADLTFVVKNYRDTKDRFFNTEIDEMIIQLEDHQM